MAKREFLGGFELLVLLALIRLGDDAYGVPISDAIEESSGREVAIGSVYITRSPVSRPGAWCLLAWESLPPNVAAVRGYFRITANGLRQVRHARRTLINLWDGVPQFEGGRAWSRSHPPRVAHWLLQRWASGPQRESLV